MASLDRPRRLVVNADDFGRSHSINQAVVQAHTEGLLTTASLMVNGAAAAEAVALAREHPRLGVGLHLSLVCARSTLKPTEIPGLVDHRFQFSNHPVWAGVRYFFHRGLRWQLRHEIAAQVQKFQATGLPMDHLNGHLNLHLHPTVFGLLWRHAEGWGIRGLRLTRDPFWLNARLASGRWAYRISHALVFNLLAAASRRRLLARGIKYTRQVFGLLQNGQVTEAFLLRLLPRLPPGDTELYCHPSLDEARPELEALLSPRVRALARELNLATIRYQDL